MAKYQAYAEYKDSGVEWLGEIPCHWDLMPVGRLFTRTKRTGFPSKELLSVYRDYGVIPKSSRDDNNNKPSDDLGQYQLVKINDLVMNKMKTWQGSIAISEFEGIVSPAYFVYQPMLSLFKKAYPKYVHYLLRNPRYIAQYLRRSKGIRVNQWDLDPDEFQKIELLIPPKDEQQKIFDFLDHETSKIDHLIEKQQQLIELLKEKRQAVISHAVTKGLDPNVPMKDSGVEWLGEVPEHWGILPIKYLTESVNTGGTPKNPISFTDVDEVNWFTPGDFLNDLEITVSSKYVTFDSVNTGDSKLYPRGSVLMIGIGATLGKIAICNTEFSCNQQINVLVPNRSIISEYLAYALIIQMDQIKQLSNSSTIGIINQEKTKQIVIALPALDEQVKIVEKITQKLLGFKKIIDLSEEQVELLKERRTALISAAVTGKIDVRHWQSPTVAETQTELSA